MIQYLLIQSLPFAMIGLGLWAIIYAIRLIARYEVKRVMRDVLRNSQLKPQRHTNGRFRKV